MIIRHDDRSQWRLRALALSPVFIVGEARSGTSILFRSLQHHPSFSLPTGLNLAESQAVDLLLDAFDPADVDCSSPLANYAHSVDGVKAVLADVRFLTRRRRAVRAIIGRGRLIHRSLWLAAGEPHVVRRYFLEAFERRGARLILDKSPQQRRWVSHLGTALPRARFLYIMRHPLDVLSSYLRRYAVDPEGSAWANIDDESFCHRWATGIERANTLAAEDPRFLIIRYEQLTADTEAVLRRTVAHLGEPFDERCLLAEPESHTFDVDPALSGTVVSITKRWQDYLEPERARRIENRLHRAMARAEYDRHAG